MAEIPAVAEVEGSTGSFYTVKDEFNDCSKVGLRPKSKFNPNGGVLVPHKGHVVVCSGELPV